MKIFSKLVFVFFAVILAGCAEMAKRDMVDHSAKEEPIYLATCAKAYPIVFDDIDMMQFLQNGGEMMISSQPSLNAIAQEALSKSGCGTTTGALYKVKTSFDVTGKMLGAMCGVQVGGYYALVMGSYGGRCVNFKSAKVTLAVVDMKSKKTLLTVTASTDASPEDEIAGGRWLKGFDKAGEFERTPEGRIVAGLMKKSLDSLVGEMSRAGLATVDIKPGTNKTVATSGSTPPADSAFEGYVKSQSATTGYVPSKAEKDAARKKKYDNTYAPR